ncbi:MAG: type IV pilus modification protein PilV [Gammaproteobacteria bacterium]|nr:MAG: type IV pilus modification protein PilV [Gammaproteobacteria bacterium]
MNRTFQKTRQGGVGLVEVMIALMIFSMGMLGIASLQVISKRSSFEAQQRQEAVWIANDMIARIKNSGLTSSQLKTYYDGKDFAADPDNPPDSPSVDCLANSCTVAQLVEYDLISWHKNIYGASVEASGQNVSGLSNAKGCIDVTESGGETTKVTVTVAWLSLTKMSGTKTRVCSISDGGQTQREVSFNTFILN